MCPYKPHGLSDLEDKKNKQIDLFNVIDQLDMCETQPYKL